MSQRKMMTCSMGALFLLPWFGALVLGETRDDFSQCLDFFYKRTPPEGIPVTSTTVYQPICQRYQNKYRFASLYHKQHRVPLYSAYILSLADGKRPPPLWKYEPQLVSRKESPEMQPFPKSISRAVCESQAVPRDYARSGYTRGHLNPSMHQRTKEDREATFTLTNIVPQQEKSNKFTWNQLENEMSNRSKAYCKGPMYVITGAMPYESATRWINNRVSVPEYMWSAYCCPSFRTNLPESVNAFFPTYAAVGRNDPNSDSKIVPVDPHEDPRVRGYGVRQMSLKTLEDILSKRLKMPSISLFRRQCK